MILTSNLNLKSNNASESLLPSQGLGSNQTGSPGGPGSLHRKSSADDKIRAQSLLLTPHRGSQALFQTSRVGVGGFGGCAASLGQQGGFCLPAVSQGGQSHLKSDNSGKNIESQGLYKQGFGHNQNFLGNALAPRRNDTSCTRYPSGCHNPQALPPNHQSSGLLNVSFSSKNQEKLKGVNSHRQDLNQDLYGVQTNNSAVKNFNQPWNHNWKQNGLSWAPGAPCGGYAPPQSWMGNPSSGFTGNQPQYAMSQNQPQSGIFPQNRPKITNPVPILGNREWLMNSGFARLKGSGSGVSDETELVSSSNSPEHHPESGKNTHFLNQSAERAGNTDSAKHKSSESDESSSGAKACLTSYNNAQKGQVRSSQSDYSKIPVRKVNEGGERRRRSDHDQSSSKLNRTGPKSMFSERRREGLDSVRRSTKGGKNQFTEERGIGMSPNNKKTTKIQNVQEMAQNGSYRKGPRQSGRGSYEQRGGHADNHQSPRQKAEAPAIPDPSRKMTKRKAKKLNKRIKRELRKAFESKEALREKYPSLDSIYEPENQREALRMLRLNWFDGTIDFNAGSSSLRTSKITSEVNQRHHVSGYSLFKLNLPQRPANQRHLGRGIQQQ